MGYCILNTQIGGYNGKGRKQNSSGFERNVWSNVCKLDAVIDYGLLSLTTRHMETVTVFRHAHTDMRARARALALWNCEKNSVVF